ncbi:hypothetical protein AHiyo8_00850 [Arthrobacter sp. Hiyo8]|nr:hypothetical protein AHiyo8_00850 [Arthrobacter sp. Hiyo8]
MWTELDNQGFENEEDYLKSLKKEDSYTFSYPFEYIAKNHGNDKYDIDMATMEVRVEWSDFQVGYVISYSVPICTRSTRLRGTAMPRGSTITRSMIDCWPTSRASVSNRMSSLRRRIHQRGEVVAAFRRQSGALQKAGRRDARQCL